MKQSQAFLDGEADAWYARNKDKPRLPDPVLQAMESCHLDPKRVIELGCGDGWRLVEINRLYRPTLMVGYDPSTDAYNNRLYPNIWRSDALEGLSYISTPIYDTIIFGFCLYLVDREDLLSIVGHTDRILVDGGHIFIHDFIPEYPYRRKYEHKEGLWSYKMDYARLWLAHPGYRIVYTTSRGWDDGRVGVTVLQKCFSEAFPERTI